MKRGRSVQQRRCNLDQRRERGQPLSPIPRVISGCSRLVRPSASTSEIRLRSAQTSPRSRCRPNGVACSEPPIQCPDLEISIRSTRPPCQPWCRSLSERDPTSENMGALRFAATHGRRVRDRGDLESPPMVDTWSDDACSLVDAFRRGERSPVEELESSLSAIGSSSLNAFSFLDPERALDAAERADVSLPFGGLPVGIKELEPGRRVAEYRGVAGLQGPARQRDLDRRRAVARARWRGSGWAHHCFGIRGVERLGYEAQRGDAQPLAVREDRWWVVGRLGSRGCGWARAARYRWGRRRDRFGFRRGTRGCSG